MDIKNVSNDIIVGDNEFGRMSALLHLTIGELDYYPTVGIDVVSWLEDKTEYTTEQFDKYLLSELARYEFNILSLTSHIKENKLFIEVSFQDTKEVFTYAL